MVKDHGSIWDLPGWKMEKNEPNECLGKTGGVARFICISPYLQARTYKLVRSKYVLAGR